MSVSTILQDAHVWIAIALVAVLALLWQVRVHTLVTTTLDNAGAKVQAQLDEAHRLREEAQAMLVSIQTQRAATEKAAAEMLAAAQGDAERMRAEAAERLEETIKRRAAIAERKIALAEAQALTDVKAAAADMAARAAEGVLSARIAGAQTDPLIDTGLSQLGARFS